MARGRSGERPMAAEHRQRTAREVERRAGEVRTPQGTMLVVLVYIAITVLLWGYVYYDMLRFEGITGGH